MIDPTVPQRPLVPDPGPREAAIRAAGRRPGACLVLLTGSNVAGS